MNFNPADPKTDCARLDDRQFAEVADSLRNHRQREIERAALEAESQTARIAAAESERDKLRAEIAAIKAGPK